VSRPESSGHTSASPATLSPFAATAPTRAASLLARETPGRRNALLSLDLSLPHEVVLEPDESARSLGRVAAAETARLTRDAREREGHASWRAPRLLAVFEEAAAALALGREPSLDDLAAAAQLPPRPSSDDRLAVQAWLSSLAAIFFAPFDTSYARVVTSPPASQMRGPVASRSRTALVSSTHSMTLRPLCTLNLSFVRRLSAAAAARSYGRVAVTLLQGHVLDRDRSAASAADKDSSGGRELEDDRVFAYAAEARLLWLVDGMPARTLLFSPFFILEGASPIHLEPWASTMSTRRLRDLCLGQPAPATSSSSSGGDDDDGSSNDAKDRSSKCIIT